MTGVQTCALPILCRICAHTAEAVRQNLALLPSGRHETVRLAAMLRGLEKGPALLAVRRLSVRPQSVDSPPGQVEALVVRFTVEGLVFLSPQKDRQ